MMDKREREQEGEMWDYSANRAAVVNANAWQIANVNDFEMEPDSNDSLGGKWLRDTRDRAVAIRDEHLEFLKAAKSSEATVLLQDSMEDKLSEMADEVADNSIEWSTYNKWRIFTELGGFRDPDPDRTGIPGDNASLAAIVYEDDPFPFSDLPDHWFYQMSRRIAFSVFRDLDRRGRRF